MLYFRRKPDPVFTAILHSALESEGERIKGFTDDDLDSWEGCYPHSSRYFTAAAATEVVTQLYCASRDPIIYRFTDYHGLLLYEVLENFCVIHNDLAPEAPKGWRPVGGYQLLEIDFLALVELYFWDTDFLIALEPFNVLGTKHQESGCNLQPTQLHIERVDPASWDNEVTPIDVFTRGSLRYPD
jgi:hypothetical protein